MSQASRGSVRWPGSLGPLFGVLIASVTVIGVVLLAVGRAAGAVAAGALVGLLLLVGAFDAVAARRKLETHRGDAGAVAADEEDSVPALPGDSDVPVGATDQSHVDLEPYDLPPGHPARRAIEDCEETAGHRNQPR